MKKLEISLYLNEFMDDNLVGTSIIEITDDMTYEDLLHLMAQEQRKNLCMQIYAFEFETVEGTFNYFLNNVIIEYNRNDLVVTENNKNLKEIINLLNIKDKMCIKVIYGIGALFGVIPKPFIKFECKPNEDCGHNFAHVHVEYDSKEASYNILTGEYIVGSKFKSKIDRLVKDYINENKEELINFWNLKTNGLKVCERFID